LALANLIQSLIAAVETHRQPANDQLEDIRRLDAEIAAECWKRHLAIPKIDSGSYEPFGQTQIPHVCGWPVEPGTGKRLSPLHYHFEATDNWLQAMRALALMDNAMIMQPQSATVTSRTSGQNLALDEVTLAKARAMNAYLKSLSTVNTTVQSLVVSTFLDPHVHFVEANNDPIGELSPEERANRAKLFPGGVPTNANIVDLVVRIDAARGTGKSLREIGLEFTGGDRRKALSLLSQIRRMKREGRITL
jgi:hypothetical protein